VSGSGGTAAPEQIWAEVEKGLSHDPRDGVNVAVEACSRHAVHTGRPALIIRHADGSSERWTFTELDRHAAKASRVFARAGLRSGDRVATLLSRQVESWIVALAAWRSGLVHVPLFCGFGADALAYRLNASGARLVVVDHQWRPSLEHARHLVERDVDVITVPGPTGSGLAAGDRSLWAELDQVAADGPETRTGPGDPATLMFTSGTSGEPKACVMTHGGVLALLPFVRYAMGLSSNSLLFSTADPAWSYGLFTTGAVPMMLGVPRVLYSGDFDPDAWQRVMAEEGVTCVASAPAAYRRLTASLQRRGVPPRLRLASAAGEPLGATVAHEWRATGAPAIHDGYGLSEVGMVLGDLADPPTGTEPGSLAGPIPGFEVLLVDPDGNEVTDGDQGLIAIRRPRYQLTAGYENAPDKWQARWIGNLFVTEDLARRDPDGRWRFVGRADDMIITSGHNVAPAEVESALLQHPAVAEAAVVAARDPHRGTVVRAVVVPAAGIIPSPRLADQLRSEVTSRVAHYAAPRIVDFVEALPRTEVGKLRRASLRP
jgi:acetyl-CoA synthetase